MQEQAGLFVCLGGELHLVFCVNTLALEPVHVAAHAGSERILKPQEVSGRDVRRKLLLEFGGAH